MSPSSLHPTVIRNQALASVRCPIGRFVRIALAAALLVGLAAAFAGAPPRAPRTFATMAGAVER